MSEPNNPQIRFKEQDGDSPAFDEFFAEDATVHVEQMTSHFWWIGVTVGDRRWSIGFEADQESIRATCHQDEGPGSE